MYRVITGNEREADAADGNIAVGVYTVAGDVDIKVAGGNRKVGSRLQTFVAARGIGRCCAAPAAGNQVIGSACCRERGIRLNSVICAAYLPGSLRLAQPAAHGGGSVQDPLNAYRLGTKQERREKTEELQAIVGLSKRQIDKYPHELSAIRYLCSTVVVMYLGHIAEHGAKRKLFEETAHPCTRVLMSAIPIPDVDVKNQRVILGGDAPGPVNPPPVCRFHTRCALATDACKCEAPELRELFECHSVSCRHAGRIVPWPDERNGYQYE